MELKEVQNRLLIQLEESAYSFYSKDGGYNSSIGYLQAVGDCCVLAGISNDEFIKAKIRGQTRAGD
jgi:hypothetical protein